MYSVGEECRDANKRKSSVASAMFSEVATMLECNVGLQAQFGFADLFLFRGKRNIMRFWEIAGAHSVEFLRAKMRMGGAR